MEPQLPRDPFADAARREELRRQAEGRMAAEEKAAGVPPPVPSGERMPSQARMNETVYGGPPMPVYGGPPLPVRGMPLLMKVAIVVGCVVVLGLGWLVLGLVL